MNSNFKYGSSNVNCKNALYLDGAISSIYFSDPEIEKLKQANTDGSFGPVISVTKRKK